MIGFLRWLGGARRRHVDVEHEREHPNLSQLDALCDEAETQRAESVQDRKRAEHIGPAVRRRVENNHLTEGFAAVFDNTRGRHA